MFAILDGVRKIHCDPFVTRDNVFNKNARRQIYSPIYSCRTMEVLLYYVQIIK